MCLFAPLRFSLRLVVLFALGISAAAQQNPSSQPSPAPIQPSAEPSSQSSSPTETPANSQATPAAQDATSDTTSNDQSSMFVFKKDIQEVVLHATVVDEKRRLAAHLDRNNFSVFEDGKPQTITSFRREDVPVAIGILIDNSGSMRDKREQVNQAVLDLIRASNPQDQIFVVNFSQNSYLDQDFTSDVNRLEQALHRTTMQGSTALYDAVSVAATHLKNNAQLEKKILLVITDGRDNMSRETLEQAARGLQEKNGPILYAIGLMGTRPNSGREALEKLSDATGGAAFFPQSLDQVDDIARSLAHDIRSQYTIAYRPQNQNANTQYHPIMVEAKADGYGRLTVRTRNGYYTGESLR
jgi:Ca-activated chloride channel homolog